MCVCVRACVRICVRAPSGCVGWQFKREDICRGTLRVLSGPRTDMAALSAYIEAAVGGSTSDGRGGGGGGPTAAPLQVVLYRRDGEEAVCLVKCIGAPCAAAALTADQGASEVAGELSRLRVSSGPGASVVLRVAPLDSGLS